MNKNTLIDAILSLKTPEECERFLSDLCTPQELIKLKERWRVAQHLAQNIAYRKISEDLGASTTTITRVACALSHGKGGYQLMLDRLNAS